MLTLLASYVFYGWWYPPYLILLGFLTCYGYAAALIPKPSPALFAWIIAVAFLPLCFFKYTGFAIENFNYFLPQPIHLQSSWQLPLGVSFITFTVVAYLMDVHRGKAVAERDFAKFGLYVSFFPHLIAGPIMRPKELLPQFAHLIFKKKLVKIGLFLFAVGMLKKVVIADQLAPVVDQVYHSSFPVDLPHALLAFYAFAVQIYCDFSGYTDMALGIAFVLGIRLPLNFNRPYLAESVRDFWRRWHITLSRWLRDYLYIPLGGSRHGFLHTVLALLATMMLGGLWHGAAWTFVFWGALHGLFLVIEHALNTFWKNPWKFPVWLRRIWTLHVVCIAWIFFRAHGWHEAMRIFRGFVTPGDWQATLLSAVFPIALIIIYFLLQKWDRVSFSCWLVRRVPSSVIYALALVIIIASSVLSAGNPSAFIYFDF